DVVDRGFAGIDVHKLEQACREPLGDVALCTRANASVGFTTLEIQPDRPVNRIVRLSPPTALTQPFRDLGWLRVRDWSGPRAQAIPRIHDAGERTRTRAPRHEIERAIHRAREPAAGIDA